MKTLSTFIDVLNGVFFDQFGRGIYAYITSADVVDLFEQCTEQSLDYKLFALRYARTLSMK